MYGILLNIFQYTTPQEDSVVYHSVKDIITTFKQALDNLSRIPDTYELEPNTTTTSHDVTMEEAIVYLHTLTSSLFTPIKGTL
jgi:hypothetical protein